MIETEMPINEKNRTLSQWLFNPFYFLAGFKALGIGITVILITGFFAYLGNSRLNGVLDFNDGFVRPPLWISLSEGIVSWLVLSILLLVTGKIISKSRFRIIDLFGTQALARFPYMFSALAAMTSGVTPETIRFINTLILDPKNSIQLFSIDVLAFLFTMAVVIIMAIWMVTLMYSAFAVCCNITGKKAIIGFIIALLIAEIISMIIIFQFPKPMETQKLAITQSSDLSFQASKFITLLSLEEFKAAEDMFDEIMKTVLPEEELKRVWQSIQAQAGPFKSQGAIQKEKIQDFDVVYVICQFEKVSLHSQITFNGKGKIAGLYFIPLTKK
jgi:hypothetical protein